MKLLKVSVLASLAILPIHLAHADPASSAAPKNEPTQPSPAAKPSTTGPATDSGSKPDVATLLFSGSQWKSAPVGTELTYAYSKKTADPGKLGEPFDDVARLKLDKGDAPDERVVELRLFTGQHTRPSGPTRSDPQNPILLFALDLNLQNLDKAFGIPNPRYLRNEIRKAWRDDAKIESTDVDFDGKKVKGTRITITPFVDDPQKDRMLDLEGMTYTVDISDSVPGEIARIDIRAPATGTPRYAETLTLKSEAKP